MECKCSITRLKGFCKWLFSSKRSYFYTKRFPNKYFLGFYILNKCIKQRTNVEKMSHNKCKSQWPNCWLIVFVFCFFFHHKQDTNIIAIIIWNFPCMDCFIENAEAIVSIYMSFYIIQHGSCWSTGPTVICDFVVSACQCILMDPSIPALQTLHQCTMSVLVF